MNGRPESEDLQALAADCIGAVFEVLETHRVIPRPRHMPFVRWGRHYLIRWISELESYIALEQAILSTFPSSFDHDPTQPGRTIEQPHSYICRLIDACVALCTAREEAYSQRSPSVIECIQSMLLELEAEEHEFVCCLGVSDLSTTDGESALVGDVLVVPEHYDDKRQIIDRVGSSIAGAEAAQRENWYLDLPLDTTLLFTDVRAHSTMFELKSLEAQEALRTFLLILQLLQPTTCRSLFWIIGPTSRLSRVEPLYYPTDQFIRLSPVRRTATVTQSTSTVFSTIGSMLSSIERHTSCSSDRADASARRRSGQILVTSWQVALRNFSQSHGELFWHRNLVDLTTGLEAAMSDIDQATESVTFRLQTRAAALLATDDDPPRTIYRDVGVLYGLRSRIAHGSDIDLRKFDKEIKKLSTASDQSSWLRDYHLAIDRLRDLLRRALLARMCLSIEGPDRWKFGERFDIDRRLSDDRVRNELRTRWRTVMQDAGALEATEAALEPDSRY